LCRKGRRFDGACRGGRETCLCLEEERVRRDWLKERREVGRLALGHQQIIRSKQIRKNMRMSINRRSEMDAKAMHVLPSYCFLHFFLFLLSPSLLKRVNVVYLFPNYNIYTRHFASPDSQPAAALHAFLSFS